MGLDFTEDEDEGVDDDDVYSVLYITELLVCLKMWSD